MLISALCDYYDMLEENGYVLPAGYSPCKIHFVIALSENGTIADIIDIRKTEKYYEKSGKEKERLVPREMVFPERTEKPGIDSSIPEHRPMYIFGLYAEKNKSGGKDEDFLLTPNSPHDKAKKSHEKFVEKNLDFMEGINTPLVNAYRLFLQNWIPEEETENEHLRMLGKDFNSSGYAFCLSGEPEHLLQDDPKLKDKWDDFYRKSSESNQNSCLNQCAVTGEVAPIARLHHKIKGVYGGQSTGTTLVSYNDDSECSYGRKQSANSNISEIAMQKYTESLNWLLADRRHKFALDDVTVVFFAMSPKEEQNDILQAMLFGENDTLDAQQTEEVLRSLMTTAKAGALVQEQLLPQGQFDPNVDYYLFGLKPNAGRLSLKFIYRKKYAAILKNVVRFQEDLQIGDTTHAFSLKQIQKELTSPKSKEDKVNPALLSKLFESAVNGTLYPNSLLETIVRRVKTDKETDIGPFSNQLRTGLIKACINRNNQKEELFMALDKDNDNQAYLCGRLFAVLEKLQQEASGGKKLNRTIKDAYFASASSKPAIVFPTLLRLAQNHFGKLSNPTYYEILTEEIMNGLQGGFPETLLLQDQGRFMVGYYQQTCDFYKKHEYNAPEEVSENGIEKQV